ncbi:MAG TPA: cytochrome oxidase assembly protein [Opitutae bacterium]|nr:cytochrome oxidase assembly protein [Opitutae bacterium]
MASLTSQRTSDYKPLLLAFCIFALCWITLLLFAGGFTTSIKAGMAFLDWPLSNGSVNPEGWLTESDKMAEHGHRLLGMKIGLLSIGLLLWTWLREARPAVRTLARLLVLVVVLQGVLGGARVRFDQLNIMSDHNLVAQTFAVAHACGAQIVLGLLVALTLMSTRRWIEHQGGLIAEVPASIKRWGIIACISIFLQILIGAIMRHADAGLAIAQFPMAQPGSLLPAYWNFDVGIHFTHRVGAVAVLGILMILLGKIWGHASTRKALGGFAIFIGLVLVIQIYLGALTIWTVKNPYVATMHALIGAFLLASTWALTLLAHRPLKSE